MNFISFGDYFITFQNLGDGEGRKVCNKGLVNDNTHNSNIDNMNNHHNHDDGGAVAPSAAAMDTSSASPSFSSPSSSSLVPPMPWFGMDIGGTLSKLVYFEPTDTPPEVGRPIFTKYFNKFNFFDFDQGSDKKCMEERALLSNIRHYLTKNKAYGESGHRDEHLQMDNVNIDGRVRKTAMQLDRAQ